MMYITAILLGIFFGVLLKGKISNIMDFKFEKVWFILSGAAILVIIELLSVRFDFIEKNIIIFEGLIFTLLFAGFWFNRKYIGIWFIGFGALLNMLVMFLNDGKMPVSIDAVERAKLPLDLVTIGIKHKLAQINGTTRMPFLADNIVPPGFFGIGMKVISIGDLVIVLGLFLFVLQIVKSGTKYYFPFFKKET